ncbi:uncharacterized protein DUF4412 [Chitinophaga skermanii]|uniref:Uncharacterized protein DUF4412 n=1 Tax=Chitinophaga skermanii TaxID=331697 RepID=A0A327QBC4_9BACT|nr:DUF4412 domain-containing protein [Chitinophaga skermanii]RAJ00503.1 uncharacterized protein DUF4412 [Chitinophaga skermanii]
MQRILFLFVFVLVCATRSQAQYFEGKIAYVSKYTSKVDGVTDAQFGTLYGTLQQFYIKDGNYKYSYNGISRRMQLYRGQENRLYFLTSKPDTLFYVDASRMTDTIEQVTRIPGAATILGYNCDALTFRTRHGATTYYYSAQLKLDASKFAGHTSNNWAAYCEQSGAVPLKIVQEVNDYKVETTATQVMPLSLQETFFQIPARTMLQSVMP